MKRGVFDVLRRGLDNAVANWGLIVIRVVEVVLLVGITIAAAVAVIVPLLVSIGVSVTRLSTPEDLEELVLSLFARWAWMLWIFLGISVLLLVFVVVHSLVEAGCARVAIDADRAAGPAVEGPRSRYRVFSLQRWWAGAKDGWWAIFWIYNFAWGVAGLILLVPLIPTAVIMLVARDTPAVLIGTGCVGLALTVLLLIVVGMVTSMWTARATVEWASRGSGATAALSDAWAAIKADVGRHLLIALAVIVIAMAGSSFFASFSYFAAFGEMFHRSATVQIFTIPLRFIASLLNWGFSAFVSNWYLAAYGALAVESTQREVRAAKPL
jgi:hypothetical protein